MSGQNRILIGILVIVWIAFGFWQIANRDLLKDAPEGVVRLDLFLVLPALVAITLGLLYMIMKDSSKQPPKGQ